MTPEDKTTEDICAIAALAFMAAAYLDREEDRPSSDWARRCVRAIWMTASMAAQDQGHTMADIKRAIIEESANIGKRDRLTAEEMSLFDEAGFALDDWEGDQRND